MTDRTKVRRLPERGVYDPDTVRGILTSNYLCHVAFVADHGPVVLPTLYGVEGDTMYIHGSAGAHMLRGMKDGLPVSVAVTSIQGLVIARSVFHNSVNYRSVVIFGTAKEITDVEEKLAALRSLTNHIVPGRWEESRRPSTSEFTQTLILKLPLTEASAKVRTGPPKDEPEDWQLPVWAGVLPLTAAAGQPVPDSHVPAGMAPSESVSKAAARWAGPA